MNTRYCILLSILFVAFAQTTYAQQQADDSVTIPAGGATVQAAEVVTVPDTATKPKKAFEPNPKKAGMYSSILPGMGQAYNRQYWKVPVVYAVLGVAGYFIGYNYDNYTKYRQAYVDALAGDPSVQEEFGQYSVEDLQRLQSSYRKDLDVIVLLTAVAYGLQIMDAVASAHLKNFDISRDISMHMKPVIQNNYIGVGLVMNLK